MKLIHIPSRCPKCDNKVYIEKLENRSANAYCMHCDFLLHIDKKELEDIEDYILTNNRLHQ